MVSMKSSIAFWNSLLFDKQSLLQLLYLGELGFTPIAIPGDLLHFTPGEHLGTRNATTFHEL
jgi:hypothetical protein